MKALQAVLLGALLFPPAANAGQPAGDGSKTAQVQYLKGTLLERRGDYAEALEAYEKAMAADPQSSYICREAADLALEIGLLDKAQQWIRHCVELDPKATQSLILRGRVEWARGDTEEAQASFEAALKLDPKSAESIFSLGNLLSARSPEKARALLERFLKENPAQAPESHYQIAKLDLQLGRFEEAEFHLRNAIELDPDLDSLPIRYALAQAYETHQSTEAALSEYLEILKLEPRNVPLLNHIGQIYFLKNDWEQARTHFVEAKGLAPGDPVSNHWLALYAEHQGEFGKAADYLKASSSLAEDPTLNMRLSYYLTQAGRLKEAVAVLESAHARWPANDQVAYFLALGYDDLKDDAPAVKLLREVVALKPDYRDARYQLAVLLERAGDIAGAEKEFKALLARNPDDAAVLNYLGYSLADRGLKLDEAERLIRSAVALDPKNGAYQDSLGWVHFKQGRSTEAVAELLESLASLSEDDTVWDHLGDAYAVAGSSVSAWLAWKRAEVLAAPEARKPKKALALQGRFGPEELGAYYLRHLNDVQGGLQKVSGLCELKGAILGRSFSYSGIFTFRAPDELDIDLLGPLFTPMFRIRLTKDGFQMDPLRLEGLKPEAVVESASLAFAAIRDYLSGALFARSPARYKKGWHGAEIEVPGWRLDLSSDGLLTTTLWPAAPANYHVALEEFGRYKGRQIPRTIKVYGGSFTLAVQFNSVNLDLAPPPLGGR